jgi:hypothetical protein
MLTEGPEGQGPLVVGLGGTLRSNSSTELSVEQLTIDTSHCPFLSRPQQLAELLVHATTTKPVGPLDPN